MNNKIFISGPITGHHDWRDMFEEAEECVRMASFFDRYGGGVIEGETYEPVSALSYGRKDVSRRRNMVVSLWNMLWCSTVYFMRGWHMSKGARIEFLVADILGKRMIFEEDVRCR